ncbi:hypothetical protein HW132_30575 [Brasilonema sp. CT11]|nr:hypothetical protein [Brasilonema sp. CT11]
MQNLRFFAIPMPSISLDGFRPFIQTRISIYGKDWDLRRKPLVVGVWE